ncbi:hypothetical protein C3E97_029865 [Pseudomonas sp. MWU12-2115]|nr:hypothetical protein C3E97_029865 [Pseudomonas sp. MWU12-2115]
MTTSRKCIDLESCIFPCGSGLAREGVVSAAINVEDTPLSRASPLPQGYEGGVTTEQQAAGTAQSLANDRRCATYRPGAPSPRSV